MDQAGEFILSSDLQIAEIATAKNPQVFEFKLWSKVLETRWIAALGRSRHLCVLSSILFHLAVFLLFLVHLPGIGDRHEGAVASVVPVELVTVGDETNLAAMVSRQLPFAPSNEQVDAATPPAKPESAPGLEMKLFPIPPPEQPKPIVRQNEGAGSNNDGKPPSSLRDAKVGDYDITKIGAGTAMTMSASDFLRNQIALCWRRSREGGRSPSCSNCIWMDRGPLNARRIWSNQPRRPLAQQLRPRACATPYMPARLTDFPLDGIRNGVKPRSPLIPDQFAAASVISVLIEQQCLG